MGNTDKGLFIPVRLTDKVCVTANDTTPDYLDNKIAEGSRIGKNTLNPTGNEQLQIVVAEVGGVWIACNPADGGVQPSTTSPYQFLGPGNNSPAGASLIGTVQFRVPRDITLTALYLHTSSTLTGGEIASCRFNINGSPDATIVATLTSASGQVVGATGELEVSQDQKLCLEWQFSGGLANVNLRFVTVSYLVLIES
jgi:hypothetical protein